MRPGDRLVCALIEPLEVEYEFSRWPLHATVVPWFRLDMATEELSAQLSVQLARILPFEAVLEGTATFGRDGKKLVHLVAEPTAFRGIEQLVRAFLHSHNAWLVDETTKMYRPFRPHVTNQTHVTANEGMTWNVHRLYIIEQRGGTKVVAGKIELLS